MTENEGVSETPRTPTEEAANAALDLFTERVEAAGGEVERVVMFAWVKPMRPNAVSVAAGFDDPGDLFTFLLSQAAGVGKQLGVNVDVIPYETSRGQG
jgi:hypothetical protein